MVVKRKKKLGAGGVAAVEHALRMLLAFQDGDGTLTLGELSRRTGFSKSTLLPLAVSLERERFLVRPEGGRFRLGSALLALGNTYERALDLRDVVEPVLQALSEATGESASFQIREGDRRVVAMYVGGRQTVRENIPAGMMLPLDRGASGHVLVQYGVPADRLPPIRIIVSVGEYNPEITAAAAPVFGLHQKLIGALSGSGTVARLSVPERLQMMKSAVREHARALTSTLGGDPALFESDELTSANTLGSILEVTGQVYMPAGRYFR